MTENTADSPANGPAAAALLSASIGSAVLGICALAGDASATIGSALSWSHPTGPLSGVTDVAIIVWLIAWVVLARRWTHRDVVLRRVSWISVALFALGLLLTFPPFMDLLEGR